MSRAAATLTLASLWLAFVTAGQAATLQKGYFDSGGARRSYYYFLPDSIEPADSPPLLVLLHGSFSTGSELARKWTELAAREGVVLLAPNARDNTYWSLRTDGPGFIRDAVEALAARHPLDRQRVFLFGHSGGAVHALTLGMLESEYFAAVAVHAGSWREARSYDALRLARRKIPVALLVGDRDRYFSVLSVRQTADALRSAGHPVSITILPRHDHNYDAVAPQIAADAWSFLRAVRLEGEPRFQAYD